MVFFHAAPPQQPPEGLTPSHKITAGDSGDDVSVYWFVQEPSTAPGFDPGKHRDLVELMHAKGQQFKIGGFESFAIGMDRNYHLGRLGPREFTVKSLR